MNKNSQVSSNLSPMPLWEAGLFFGIPAIITIFCVYSVFPYLVKHGFSTFVSYAIVLDIPLTIIACSIAGGLQDRGQSNELASIEGPLQAESNGTQGVAMDNRVVFIHVDHCWATVCAAIVYHSRFS
jgi:hypothetical protein